jgi:hypothetical protein
VLPSNYKGVPLKGEGEGASRGHMVVLLKYDTIVGMPYYTCFSP